MQFKLLSLCYRQVWSLEARKFWSVYYHVICCSRYSFLNSITVPSKSECCAILSHLSSTDLRLLLCLLPLLNDGSSSTGDEIRVDSERRRLNSAKTTRMNLGAVSVGTSAKAVNGRVVLCCSVTHIGDWTSRGASSRNVRPRSSSILSTFPCVTSQEMKVYSCRLSNEVFAILCFCLVADTFILPRVSMISFLRVWCSAEKPMMLTLMLIDQYQIVSQVLERPVAKRLCS